MPEPTSDEVPERRWLTPGVVSVGVASLASDANHEVVTSLLPGFLTSTLHAGPAALGAIEGFSRTYGCKRLVWYEVHELMTAAIQREKTMKRWPRDWKVNLIERDNPDWSDLYGSLA